MNFNRIFDTARKTGKPVGLVAFIVALLAYGYVYTISEQRRMIETAPEADRARLIEAVIRDFTQIDTTGMSEKSKYNLIIETIEAREKRFFVTATVAVIVSFLIFLALILVGRSGGDRDDLRRKYLRMLASETNLLPWANLHPEYADPEKGSIMGLSDIYTPLDTTELEKMDTEDQVRNELKSDKARRISAQEMIDSHEKLVLLGDPGSGKSTLINFITYILAKAGLEKPDLWLDRLKETGPWHQSLMLPIRVILREFALHQGSGRTGGKQRDISAFLEKESGDAWPVVRDAISGDEPCLVLFDGLDEVPESQRKNVLSAIGDFTHKHGQHRYIVTCRIYAYIDREYRLFGFHKATLTDFSDDQIRQFIDTWYRKMEIRGRFTENEARRRAEELKNAATLPYLSGLAKRPLLMTVMALLHGFRGQLPDDRVELYQWAVDLLLRRWESRVRDEKGLLETLDIPRLKMSELQDGLYDVAFAAHEGQDEKSETADIDEGMLRKRLAPYLDNKWDKAGIFVDYVRERAGLLIRHKPEAYTFPHRTFQEFMAACHLTSLDDYPEKAAELVCSDRNRWRIVFVLAAGHAAKVQKIGQAVNSVNALCPCAPDSPPDADFYGNAEIGGEALLEIGLLSVQRKSHWEKVLNQTRDRLLEAISADGVLSPKERVSTGNVLSRLGDPRFDPENFYLPFGEEMGFVRIDSGRFFMGTKGEDIPDIVKRLGGKEEWFRNEAPIHEVELSSYRIAKYPVTVAQYRYFVEESGHPVDEKWRKDNTFENHPVVSVSWEDATAYCKWLTEKMNLRGIPGRIDLPTEAEWEYAARGRDGLVYPWGDEAGSNRMNFRDTKIGGTSPVGCFPGGASPFGILEMAGNVWEWCGDWYGGYPERKVTDPVGPSSGSSRVSRGGGWFLPAVNCRSASRYFDSPGRRGGSLGFRLKRT